MFFIFSKNRQRNYDYCDAIVRSKAVYLALGMLPYRSRDLLVIRVKNTKGAQSWMKVLNELKTREVSKVAPVVGTAKSIC
jgi:transposase-like protein